MYEIVATFDVRPESREEFINAALQDGRDSRASEPGTRRFELIRDVVIEGEGRTERFFLIEAYDDEAAFTEHKNGPHYKRFFEVIAEFANEDRARLLRGVRLDDGVGAAKGAVKVFRVDEICDDLLQADIAAKFKPDNPEHFIGEVRTKDLTGQAGLSGLEVLAVYFGAGARTKPHVHQTEQLLYFVRGSGFVVFPGQDEQIVEEGSVVIVPACELHMHGATSARPTCHLAAKLPSKTNWKPKVPPVWRQFAEEETAVHTQVSPRQNR